MLIKVCKLYDYTVLPTRKFPTDAGLDLYNYSPEKYSVVHPFTFKALQTGITIEIPKGYVGQIWPKSGSDYLVGAGIIDSSYQGEILVKIYNGWDTELILQHGTAIAQLVLVPVITPAVVEVNRDKIHQIKTARGSTGGIVKGYSQLSYWDIDDLDWKEDYNEELVK